MNQTITPMSFVIQNLSMFPLSITKMDKMIKWTKSHLKIIPFNTHIIHATLTRTMMWYVKKTLWTLSLLFFNNNIKEAKFKTNVSHSMKDHFLKTKSVKIHLKTTILHPIQFNQIILHPIQTYQIKNSNFQNS